MERNSLEVGMIQALAIALDKSGAMPLAKYIQSLETLKAATITQGRTEDSERLGAIIEAMKAFPSAWKQG